MRFQPRLFHSPDSAGGGATGVSEAAEASRQRLAGWGRGALDAAESAIRDGRINPGQFGFAPPAGFESAAPDIEALADQNPIGWRPSSCVWAARRC